MMAYLSLPLLPILMVATCFGPGFLFVRRLGWRPGETVCASIGLSLVLAYLVAGGIYVSGLPWSVGWLMTAGGVFSLHLGRADLRRLWRIWSVRQQVLGFVVLFVLGIVVLSAIRHYSGGGWSVDWLEHYERTQFFLERKSLNTAFILAYELPARPPMMNLVGALFLGEVDAGFSQFQITFLFLNLLAYFAVVNVGPLLMKPGRRTPLLIAALLAVSPFFVQNITFTWTKLHAAFFVLLAILLYVRGWRRRCGVRMASAALAMSVGILVHYSAVPYAVCLAAHFVASVLLRERRWRLGLIMAAAFAAPLATWFGWSMSAYGARSTFGSNTVVTDSARMTVADNAAKVAYNILHTVVPHPLVVPRREFDTFLDQPNPYGYVRDVFFLIYQTNLPFLFGSIGFAAVAVLATRRLTQAEPAARRFWIWLVASTAVLGIAVHGARDAYGVAHVCLLPLGLIGLAMLGTTWQRLPRWGRTALVAGAGFDALFGIVLNLRMQMLEFLLPTAGGTSLALTIDDRWLSLAAVSSSWVRAAKHIELIGDRVSVVGATVPWLAIILLALALCFLAGNGRFSWSVHRGGVTTVVLFLAGCSFIVMQTTSGAGPVEAIEPVSARAARDIAVRDAAAHPDDASAHYRMGEALLASGDPNGAMGALTKAFLLDPERSGARYALSVLLRLRQADLAHSPAAPAEAVRRDPDDVAAQCALAETLVKMGQIEVALERMRAVADAHAESAPAQLLAGRLCLYLGQSESAVGHLTQALLLSPDSTDASSRLRMALQAQGLAERAIQERLAAIRARSTASRIR